MQKILFVDLDHSLIRTDIFQEQFFRSLITHPLKTLCAIFKNKFKPAPCKATLLGLVKIDPQTLPYTQKVLSYIEAAKARGEKVVLATATHQKMAEKIADYLGLFDAVLATTDTFNCKGEHKLKAMQDYAKGAPFTYVGDSSADVIIFKAAEKAVIVGGLHYNGFHERIRLESPLIPFFQSLRVHQWAKNLLIFLPLLVSHSLMISSYLTVLSGFVVFSLAASSMYLLNDVADIEDDRHHPYKKNRPLPRGAITLKQSLLGALLLLGLSLGLTSFLFREALNVLLIYLILTLLYSFVFKTKPVLDVFCLSLLYALRLVFGCVLTGIHPTAWLIVFSVFFFLGLGFMKRATELRELEDATQPASRRGYLGADTAFVSMAGICSGLISILVLGFYMTSEQAHLLYAVPAFLWGAAFVLLYWQLRLWLKVARGEMHHDPVVFAIRDTTSYVLGTVIVVFGLLAKGVWVLSL